MATTIENIPVTTRDIQVRSDYKSGKKKSGGKPEQMCITDMHLFRHPEGTRIVNCCRYHGIDCDTSSSWIVFDDPDMRNKSVPPAMQ